MGDRDYSRDYSNLPDNNRYQYPPAVTPSSPPAQPSPATGSAPPPATTSPPAVTDAAEVSADAQAAGRINNLPANSMGDLFALGKASDQLEQDIKTGAPPAKIDEDAAVLEALLIVEKAKNDMDQTILKAFDEMLKHAQEMMDKYKEWVAKVKVPEEQKMHELQDKKQAETEVAKKP